MQLNLVKKLNKSKYNIEVKTLENGDILMFNTLKTSLGVINKLGKEIYDNIDTLSINEIKDLETLKIVNGLISTGFLVEDSLDEYKYYENLFLKSKFINNSLHLTLAVTLDCNMSCPYCFETKNKSSYMNKDTANGIFEFIKNYKEYLNISALHINWFGGEPLLNLDIIEYLSEILINYCIKNNIKYSASMPTNGVLLNKTIANNLKALKLTSIEITIDGLKEIHNRRRILNNKQESYDIILNNIIECKDIIPITVRINIDKENIHGIYDLFDELNKRNIKFYYRPVVDNDKDNKSSEKVFTQDEFSKIDMDLIEYLHKNCDKKIDGIYPDITCGACDGNRENSYVIDPYGLLHKCNAFLSDPDRSIGNIFDGITSHSENIKWIGFNIPQKCKECNKLPICGSPCPLELINNSNSDIECPFDVLDIEERLDLYLMNK